MRADQFSRDVDYRNSDIGRADSSLIVGTTTAADDQSSESRDLGSLIKEERSCGTAVKFDPELS